MIEPVSFSSTTPRLALPLLFAGQSQKEFLVNETISRLDTLLVPVIQSETATAPGSPVDGDAYLVADNATGEWAGMAGFIAVAAGGNWQYIPPLRGMRIYDTEHGEMLLYNGGWQRPGVVATPAGGTTVDAEARQTVTDLVQSLRTLGIIR